MACHNGHCSISFPHWKPPAWARKNRHRQFVIDGAAVLLGVDGISDFDGLHSRRHDEEVQLCAFDVLALKG